MDSATGRIGALHRMVLEQALDHLATAQLASAAAFALLNNGLDEIDGDPDLEDATDLEDDHSLSPQAIGYASGPGCQVADQDAGSWTEWQSRGRHKDDPGMSPTHGQLVPEDAEDDDPAELAGDEADGNFAEDEACAEFTLRQRGPGCIISDPDAAVDDQGCDPDEGV